MLQNNILGKKRVIRRLASVFLILALMLTGCAGKDDEAASADVKVNQTVSRDSKWVDSSIIGAIDESLETDAKDDFFTAVNKDWLLAQYDSGSDSVDFGTDSEELLDERLSAIFSGDNRIPGGENSVGLSGDWLVHDAELLTEFSALASNWEERNREGAKPLKPYLDAIEQIKDMEELTDYLTNADGMNLAFVFPVAMDVGTTYTNHDKNTVILGTCQAYSLSSFKDYSKISKEGRTCMYRNEVLARQILGDLGYSEGERSSILKGCYRFEMRLAQIEEMLTGVSSLDIGGLIDETDNTFDMQGLCELAGNYPVGELLSAYGYDCADSYAVYYPRYVSAVGALYQEKYIEEMKDYFMVHTMIAAADILDRETYDEIETAMGTDADEDKSEDERDKEILFAQANSYLSEPLGQVYVARFCSKEQKETIETLVEAVLLEYEDMIREEDWLSGQMKENAVEKLKNIAVRAVYPDTFNDYSSLDISTAGTLVDAIAEIKAFSVKRKAEKINTPKVRNEWDLGEMATTVCNAYYMPSENSINILAGLLSSEMVYPQQGTYEQLLAKIGMIIGHEITHGFDRNGYQYDKDGYFDSWWTTDDEMAFQTRSEKLVKYYSSLVPYPGAAGYDGYNVSSEAIADMGGMKCVLHIAEKAGDFDYREFFEAYADMWKSVYSYDIEIRRAEDEHPLGYLRVNVTLQQFEEFYETYGIEEGDGMYLAPDKRIAVW